MSCCCCTVSGVAIFGLLVLLFFRKQIYAFRERMFAQFIDRFLGYYNETSKPNKERIFKVLKDIKSKDPELRKKGQLRILEIGCGTGANLSFLPEGSQLVMLDPNEAFKPLLEKNLRKHPKLTMERFVLGKVEQMSSIPDESVDAVICTLVLCSVDSLAAAFAEVHRVLAPGGKFIFLEHVAAEEGTLLRSVQWFLSESGIWPTIFCGCLINKELPKHITKAGFSDAQYRHVNIFNPKMKILFYFIQSQLEGIVTK